ncbi:DUF6760 family protein [Chroococcidiopsis sp. SAG 2025]|uniref:DUF6760 family protein n=1 Tax=Chroococcidiopsis sp. SAG 2025 TaxID=171389 RepID=UPI0039778271
MCRGVCFSGGVLSYPSAQLYEEVAFIAFHFHWSQAEILNLDHTIRKRWVNEINQINQKIATT